MEDQDPIHVDEIAPDFENERRRILQEYDILDTPPEPAFDELTALAAHICGVPISMISFTDDKRYWFKSVHGIAAKEVTRELSFCEHVITGGATMVVPDALLDPRFVDNRLLMVELGVRFYAGAILKNDAGIPFGTICVVDKKPGQLSVEQRAMLEVLARLVVNHLELRKAVRNSEAVDDIRKRSLSQLRSVSEYLNRLTGTQPESAEGLQINSRQELADQALVVTSAEAAVVEIAESGDMVFKAVAGKATPLIGFRYRTRTSFSGKCFLSRRTMHCEDVDTDPFVNAESCRQHGIDSMIVTPLFEGETPIGVLKVWSSRKHGFGQADIYSMQLIAGAYTAAMARANGTEINGAGPVERPKELTRIQDLIRSIRDQSDLLNMTYDAIILRDMDSRILYWNRGATETYGWSEAQASGRISHDLLKTVCPISIEDVLRKVLVSGRWEGDVIHTRRDGRKIVITSRQVLQRDTQGAPIGLLEVNTDITERKAAEDALRRSEATLRTFFSSSPLMMGIVETVGDDILHISDNATARDFFGYVDTPGTYLESDMDIADDQIRTWLLHYQASERTGKPVRFEFSRETPLGRSWLSATVSFIGISSSGNTRFSYVVEDVTSRVEAAQQLEEQMDKLHVANVALESQADRLAAVNSQLATLSNTDSLTGVRNRRAFEEKLREEHAFSQSHHTPLSLLLLDVDYFKAFNDKFGHPAGDSVLGQVGTILSENARIGDCVARYGGEEFAVILVGTDSETALVIAERFRELIQTASWSKRTITASFGVATKDNSMTSEFDLVAAADTALYQSKQNGRNMVSVATGLVPGTLASFETLTPAS
ncbi:MAG: diguanylate cyclase [Chthonomonadales bacterium]